MKPIPNEIVLRPRFQIELGSPNEVVLKKFEGHPNEGSLFVAKRIDDHVFIKISQEEAHFWSPQLHLEINKIENDVKKSRLYGLFGPNPTLWTFFMFLHFGVATTFIIFGIWAYSNWSLKTDYGVQLAICLSMIFGWISLYVLGRVGKLKGKEQMHQLYEFKKEQLELSKSNQGTEG